MCPLAGFVSIYLLVSAFASRSTILSVGAHSSMRMWHIAYIASLSPEFLKPQFGKHGLVIGFDLVSDTAQYIKADDQKSASRRKLSDDSRPFCAHSLDKQQNSSHCEGTGIHDLGMSAHKDIALSLIHI